MLISRTSSRIPGRKGTRAALSCWTGLVLVAMTAAVAPAAGEARAIPESFADLAEKLLPAVVNISTTQVTEGKAGVEMPQFPPGSPFEEFFKEFFEFNRPRGPQKYSSLGSGFVIDQRGYVVTNNHVIQDADEIEVSFNDNTKLPAEVVGRDSKTDIAVLKVQPTKPLATVKFGDSDGARVGDWVLAIGNPLKMGGTVTAGIISARGRDIASGPYDDFIQTDASINKGNSGGPLFNVKGEVIGINTAILSPSGGSIGIGFAIPSSTAEPLVHQLIDQGKVTRGWLGVRIQRVNEEIAESLGIGKAEGALVASIIKGSPAEDAKLQPGDVILSFDGKSITEMRRLPRLVADTPVGRTADLVLWRGGNKMTVKVKIGRLEDNEEEEATASAKPSPKDAKGTEVQVLGLTLSSITPKLREKFDIEEGVDGAVVLEVERGSAAAEKGIRVGDVIMVANNQDIVSPEEVKKQITAVRDKGGKNVLLLVHGQGGAHFVSVPVGKG